MARFPRLDVDRARPPLELESVEFKWAERDTRAEAEGLFQGFGCRGMDESERRLSDR